MPPLRPFSLLWLAQPLASYFTNILIVSGMGEELASRTFQLKLQNECCATVLLQRARRATRRRAALPFHRLAAFTDDRRAGDELELCFGDY